MKATPDVVGMEKLASGHSRLVKVKSYLEAAGVLAAHRAGISPLSLRPGPVAGVPMADGAHAYLK